MTADGRSPTSAGADGEPSASARPGKGWFVFWGLATALVLAPVVGVLIVFVLFTLAWIPLYPVVSLTGFGFGNWSLLVATWALIALLISRLHHARLGPARAWRRASYAAAAAVVLLEASGITVCRITVRDAAPEPRRVCYPHVAGWIATEHLRRWPAPSSKSP